MRFLIIVKATAASESGAPPHDSLIEKMAGFHEELARAGALLDASGLMPSAAGWRIRYRGAQREVIEGPFHDEAPLMAGYTLFQARDYDEALEWSRRFPNPVGEGAVAEIEVRPLHSLDHLPPSESVERFKKLGLAG